MATIRKVDFEQGETAYAECDEPAFCFDEILAIDCSSGQTRTLEEIVFPVDIVLGETRLEFAGKKYELIIKSVRIWLDKDNCDYVPGSRYGGRMAMFEGTHESEQKAEEKRGWKAGFGGVLGADKQSLGGEIGYSRSGDRTASRGVKAQRKFNLAFPEGSDGWRASVPEGEPGGLVSQVIGAVDAAGELTPLCKLIAKNPENPVPGRIRVQARAEDLVIRAVGHRGRTKRVSEPGLRKSQKKMAANEQLQDDALREKLGALALFLPNRRKEKDAHIDLATRAFCFYPRIETEGDR